MNRLAAIAASLSIAACAQTPSTSSDQDGIPVGPSVAPRVASLSYTTYGKDLDEVQARALADERLEVKVEAANARRSGTWAGPQKLATGGKGYDMPIHASGELETDGLHPEALTELVASLPAINTQVRLGDTYESGRPGQAYLDKEFAAGHAVMWQVTKNTVRELHVEGESRLIALDVVGYNRGYELDAETQIAREVSMGVAFRARTDLMYSPATGWVMLRMRRIVQTDHPRAETAPFSELLASRHTEFTACLDGIVTSDLVNATRGDFPACK